MKVITRPAKLADARTLRLREEDQREVTDGWRERVAAVIEEGPITPLAFWSPTGELLGLGGIQVDHESRRATPWLLCAPEASQYGKDAVRLAKSCVRTVVAPLAKAGYLVSNSIGIDCPGNRAFVKHLGFVVELNYFHFPPR